MIVCVCHAVTDKQIRNCARLGCTSVEALSFELGVGTQCGCCKEFAAQVLAEEHGTAGRAAMTFTMPLALRHAQAA
jgi:bacterioferritin-associated ferredoxin